MKMHHGFDMKRAPRHLLAALALAALVFTGGLAHAGDTDQGSTSQKQTTPKTGTDKNVKPYSDAASKYDLSTPVTALKFYGSVTVGYESTFGKSAWSGKNFHQSGMFTEFQIGTGFKLSDDVMMNLLFSVGRYPNCFYLR